MSTDHNLPTERRHSSGKRGGPSSSDGKTRSSKNSTEHGMCQREFALLPDESPAEWKAVHSMWHSEYQAEPGEPALVSLVDDLAERDWIQRRCSRRYARVEQRLFEAESNGVAEEEIEKLERKLLLAIRYKTAAENSFNRALRIVEHYWAARKREGFAERRAFVHEQNMADTIVSRRWKDGRAPLLYGPESNQQADPNASTLSANDAQPATSTLKPETRT